MTTRSAPSPAWRRADRLAAITFHDAVYLWNPLATPKLLHQIGSLHQPEDQVVSLSFTIAHCAFEV